MKILVGKIDVKKIDKSRLYEGEKGTYLGITVYLNDEKDKYGNSGMIAESVSKEERLSGLSGTILGNVRIIYEDNSEEKAEAKSEPMSDDIPF